MTPCYITKKYKFKCTSTFNITLGPGEKRHWVIDGERVVSTGLFCSQIVRFRTIEFILTHMLCNQYKPIYIIQLQFTSQ